MMRRNPLILRVIVMMPIMVMLVVPLVADLDVKNVKVSIVDNDRSQLSKQIISDISSSDFFIVSSISDNHSQGIEETEKGNADVLMTIPPNYERNLTNGFSQIDIQANGVNATKGMLGARYVSEAVVNTLKQWHKSAGIMMPDNSLNVIYRFNPTLNYKNYMIPALVVILFIIICGFLPALSLVSEKETGTIEAMNVSPVSKFAFVLSKLVPYWVVAIVVITVGMIIGWLVYGLEPAGSIPIIYFAAILFSLVMSGLGIVIANKSSTMLQSIFVMFAFIIIFQLMGGLFTPIQSMPEWAQIITYAIPPRYFIEIMRSVYLKGTYLSELWLQFSALGGFALLLLILSALTYKKQS